MLPKAPPGKNGSAKKAPTPKSATPKGVKGGIGKKAKEKQKKPKLNLKGWLETKADWARFDAWAEINAQPRKIVEPEPLVRASKPLSQIKKRMALLSKPRKLPDISKSCRMDFQVSRKSLTAKPSKRIIKLAMFTMKNIDYGREFPPKISRAALSYKASKRIIEISQPQLLYLSEYCKLLVKSQNVEEKNVVTSGEEKNERAKMLALSKKAVQCPDLMTDEEMNILVTPTGIFRSALKYKITPWMNYLALPSYRFLKDQMDDKAEEWKKIIVEESEIRGKIALEDKKKKKRREEKKVKKLEEDEKNVEEIRKNEAKTDEDKPSIAVEAEEDKSNVVEKEETTANDEESEKPENEAEAEIKDTEEDLTIDDNKPDKQSSKVAQNAEVDESKPQANAEKKEEEEEDDEETAKRRKAERNAWRFEPSPCADNPFEIKKSALNAKASPRTNELAKHRERKDRSCNSKAFEVRKSALDGPVPERMAELAKPNHPLDPVERPPPREKDPFGRPIFPMPPYGKKMPRVKPYPQAECPEKEEKADDEEEKKKNEGRKRKAIDPIVYEPTIDPCIDPERAKRQKKARKAAKEEMEKRKKEDEASAESKKEDKVEEKDKESPDEPDPDN